MTNIPVDIPKNEPQQLRQLVRISGVPQYVNTLEDLVAIGEEHFGVLGRLGLGIPEHNWGLVPVTRDLQPIRHRYVADEFLGFMPEGYLLATDVAAIVRDPIPADLFQKPVNIKHRYNSSQPLSDDGIRLMEVETIYGHLAAHEQGSTGPTTEVTPGFWLNNFDLVFREV
ncbi:MAG: hypothetical protein KIH63_002035 [Candidatus Saccharibacteria bacterium]|nr:hypothetical protein [Candidatus Saccharibacteria bacterium]